MFNFNRYWINFKEDINKVRILKVLQKYPNEEVGVWKLINASKVCHYTDSIMQLRKDWYDIRNRTEQNWKVRQSFYRLNN